MKSFYKYLTIIICFAVLCFPAMLSTGLFSNLNLNLTEENKDNSNNADNTDNAKSNMNLSKFDITTFNVYFRNADDESLYQQLSVSSGETAEYTGSEPTKSSNLTFSYSFAGWTLEKLSFEDIVNITEFIIDKDTTFYAYFSETYIDYVLKLYIGTTIFKTENCTYGKRIDLTDSEYKVIRQDERYVYKFLGWWDNPNYSGDEVISFDITKDTNLYAKFHTTEIASLNKQTALIILGSLIGIVILILIFASVRVVSFKGTGQKFSRKDISEIKAGQDRIKKEKQEIEKRISEMKQKTDIQNAEETDKKDIKAKKDENTEE